MGQCYLFFCMYCPFTMNQWITCPYLDWQVQHCSSELVKAGIALSDLSEKPPPMDDSWSMVSVLSCIIIARIVAFWFTLFPGVASGYLMGARRSVYSPQISSIMVRPCVYGKLCAYPWFDLMLTLAVELRRRRISPMQIVPWGKPLLILSYFEQNVTICSTSSRPHQTSLMISHTSSSISADPPHLSLKMCIMFWP